MSLDAQILTALRQRGDAGVSGAELSQRLGVTRAAVWARIEELRAVGYDIDASPHQGYRLQSVPDLLHADDLRSLLPEVQIIGRDIRVFEVTSSTMDVAEKLARDGVREGVVVFAESQTKGRGRLGRPWLSPSRKGLWFSVLLRPDLRPQAATQLTVAAATALVRALRDTAGVLPEIKWPNDILIGGKKIAGVLTELSAELDQIKYLVLGLGVDVNLTAADLPADLRATATSLRLETGRAWRRADVAASVLRELDAAYARLGRGQFASLADEWERHCSTLGRRLTIRVGDRRLTGRAESLDEDGALLLRTEHGRLERVTGGDVTLEQ
jgi:BirA family biotin operon repressor/biotin-[acetyl-CoA-carboxylase] ligase